MKKSLSWLLLSLCLSAASCSNGEGGGNPEPALGLQPGQTGIASLSFTLGFLNAEEAAYAIYNDKNSIPTAQDLFAEGTKTTRSEETTYTIDGLTENTTYYIAAAARNQQTYTSVFDLEMTTRKADGLINATEATGGYFAGELSGGVAGDYLLNLSDIPWVDGEATGAGHQMVFSLHSTLSADADHAAPETGTYTFDASSSFEPFTFDDKLSLWNAADATGKLAGEGQFTEGSLTIDQTADGAYEIVGYVTTDEDKIYKITWKGPIEWTNRTTPPMQDQQVELNEALIYYGGADQLRNPDTDHWKIELYDDTEHATRGLMLDFYAPIAIDPLNPELPLGTFSAGSEGGVEAGTYVPGSLLLSELLGTYLVTIIRDHQQYYYCNGGTFTISEDTDGYVIDCQLETTIGTKVTGTYRGAAVIENEFRPVWNEDLTVEADRLHNSITYFGFGGLHNYLFMLSDTEVTDGVPANGGPANVVSIDLYSDVAPVDGNPAIPEGTYTFSRPNKAGTFSRAFTYGYHWNEKGRQSQKIMLKDGTLTITRTEDIYTLKLDAVTDQDHKFVCNYEGPLPYPSANATHIGKDRAELSLLPAARPNGLRLAPLPDAWSPIAETAETASGALRRVSFE